MVLVVIYHVFYMYNDEGMGGVAGKITDLDVQYFDVYQYIVYPWFMSLALLGFGVRFLDFRNAFTSWMSAHSWGLYIFHYLGISAVGLYIARPRLLAPLPVYVLSLIAGFAAGYLLYEIISRIPFFRWAVLGIKKVERH